MLQGDEKEGIVMAHRTTKPPLITAVRPSKSSYVSIMSRLILVFVAVFASQSLAADDRPLDDDHSKMCARASVEADIDNSVHLAGFYSSVMITVLSGHTREAAEDVGSALALQVLVLNEQLERNPCKATKEKLARILPMLRVVAAVNNKTPIPGVAENKEVMNVLEQAIRDNPKHYQQLLDRSKNWEHGIR